MKFTVTFKDPDTVEDCVREAVWDSVNITASEDLDDEERESLTVSRVGKILEFTSKWVEFGEYIRVEFDTEKKTAVVVPVKRG